MECPFCKTPLPDDDVFCEACGKQLYPPAQPWGEPDGKAGCSCGAPPEDIAEDGYCGRCGRLARRPATDHLEMELSADFAGVSDRGVKHQRNEDRFAMRRVGDGHVLVVCDGVSSTEQSEVASSSVAEHVADSLEASLRRHAASSPERSVRTAIQDAQARLLPMAEKAPSTTVVAALVTGLDAAIGWVGDSRAYWIGDDGETRQLTTDHSWINSVVSSGEMSLQEAALAPQAHGITRWLGADAGDNAQPDVTHFRLPDPGHLLLCTDGLWNYAQEPKQLGGLLHGAAAIDMARHLVDYANAQGGHDNITAVLLRVNSPGND
jgi:serine/threonine protein phosphatase PrpC